jgi:Domain of unknown function (DUF4265)
MGHPPHPKTQRQKPIQNLYCSVNTNGVIIPQNGADDSDGMYGEGKGGPPAVPFFLSNVAYGDTISTTTDRLGNLQFGSVLKRGGYSVYRVLVHDQYEGDAPISKFLDLDALVERNGNLIAIAVPPTKGADAVVDLILEGKRKGIWGAQDGYIHDQT